MNKTFEKENNILLAKIRKIHIQLNKTSNSMGETGKKSSSQIKKTIAEIKCRLEELKKQKIKSDTKLKVNKFQAKGGIEEKVKDLEVESILKREAVALDKAIGKVTRAEKICNSTLSKAKIELLNAELACLEVIKSKSELNEIVRQ